MENQIELSLTREEYIQVLRGKLDKDLKEIQSLVAPYTKAYSLAEVKTAVKKLNEKIKAGHPTTESVETKVATITIDGIPLAEYKKENKQAALSGLVNNIFDLLKNEPCQLNLNEEEVEKIEDEVLPLARSYRSYELGHLDGQLTEGMSRPQLQRVLCQHFYNWICLNTLDLGEVDKRFFDLIIELQPVMNTYLASRHGKTQFKLGEVEYSLYDLNPNAVVRLRRTLSQLIHEYIDQTFRTDEAIEMKTLFNYLFTGRKQYDIDLRSETLSQESLLAVLFNGLGDILVGCYGGIYNLDWFMNEPLNEILMTTSEEL